MTPSFKILNGLKSHLPDVLSLIKELAVFEKEPEAVTNTLGGLEKNLEQENFEFMVVEKDNAIIGFALCYFRYSTWKGLCLYLEDFYIQPQFRSLGIGANLFESVKNLGREKNCVLLNWQVLDWNVDAIRFYEEKGAEISKIWYNGTFRL